MLLAACFHAIKATQHIFNRFYNNLSNYKKPNHYRNIICINVIYLQIL